VLFIKGSTSDFYLLNLDFKKDELIKYINDILNIIKEPVKVDSIEIDFSLTIATFFIEKYSDFKDNELIKVLNAIKKQAKIEKKDILLVDEKSFAIEIINE